MDTSTIGAVVSTLSVLITAAFGLWVARTNAAAQRAIADRAASGDEDERIREQLWRLKHEADERVERAEQRADEYEQKAHEWREKYESLRNAVMNTKVVDSAQGQAYRNELLLNVRESRARAEAAESRATLLQMHLGVALAELHRLQGRPDPPFALGPGDEAEPDS